MKHSVWIFDLDGTLLNTLQDLTDATNYVLRLHDFPTHSVEAVRGFVGNGVRSLLTQAAPAGTSEELLNQLVKEFGVYYPQHCMDHTTVYDGLMPVLHELKNCGCQLAIVSNKPDYGVKALASACFDGLMAEAVGERAGVRRKPAPDAVLAVMESLGVSREDCIYVGDSDVDVATASAAKVDFIGVAWGFCGHAALERFGAKVIADAPEELLVLGGCR